MNPTIDEGFLAGEEARDPENFRSEYLAEWVAGGGSFFDLRSVELEDGPAAPGDGRRWLAALDPAFHADQFGVALVGESANERGVLVTGVLAGIEPGARRRSLDARREREDATLVAVWERLEPYAEGGGRAGRHRPASGRQREFVFRAAGVPGPGGELDGAASDDDVYCDASKAGGRLFAALAASTTGRGDAQGACG